MKKEPLPLRGLPGELRGEGGDSPAAVGKGWATHQGITHRPKFVKWLLPEKGRGFHPLRSRPGTPDPLLMVADCLPGAGLPLCPARHAMPFGDVWGITFERFAIARSPSHQGAGLDTCYGKTPCVAGVFSFALRSACPSTPPLM